jgi:hypothetical protein
MGLISSLYSFRMSNDDIDRTGLEQPEKGRKSMLALYSRWFKSAKATLNLVR